eukprot:362732-Chlamydomonas_euryale.AAC.7
MPAAWVGTRLEHGGTGSMCLEAVEKVRVWLRGGRGVPIGFSRGLWREFHRWVKQRAGAHLGKVTAGVRAVP